MLDFTAQSLHGFSLMISLIALLKYYRSDLHNIHASKVHFWHEVIILFMLFIFHFLVGILTFFQILSHAKFLGKDSI